MRPRMLSSFGILEPSATPADGPLFTVASDALDGGHTAQDRNPPSSRSPGASVTHTPRHAVGDSGDPRPALASCPTGPRPPSQAAAPLSRTWALRVWPGLRGRRGLNTWPRAPWPETVRAEEARADLPAARAVRRSRLLCARGAHPAHPRRRHEREKPASPFGDGLQCEAIIPNSVAARAFQVAG